MLKFNYAKDPGFSLVTEPFIQLFQRLSSADRTAPAVWVRCMVLLGMLMRCECKSQADGKPLSQLPLIHNTSSATAIQNATPIHRLNSEKITNRAGDSLV
jgi:hypothetical protein